MKLRRRGRFLGAPPARSSDRNCRADSSLHNFLDLVDSFRRSRHAAEIRTKSAPRIRKRRMGAALKHSPARVFARPTADSIWLGPALAAARSRLLRGTPVRLLV